MTAPVTIGAGWRQAQARLAESGIDPAPREGRAMVAQVTGWAEQDLVFHEYEVLTDAQQARLENLLVQRLAGQPLAYVLGGTWFYGRWWPVAPGMLIPRPDTEPLVSAVLARLQEGGTVVEVGIGSGAILGTILLERPDARGIGTDIDAELILTAGQMLGTLAGVPERVVLRSGDVLAPVDVSMDGPVDVIVSNPPYIADVEWQELDVNVRDFEPKLALTGSFADGNADGLAFYRDFVPQAAKKVRLNGWLVMEIGWQQRQAVTDLLEEKLWTNIACLTDLAGRDRVIVAQRCSPSR